MRLLVVSAHYPPDFTTGATLQAQRLAQAAARRGHDVLVYAGERDETRPPLSVRESRDGEVPVRWIATYPFLGWADRRNFDNPQVCADFRGVLQEFRPDAVHFHALQTLGAGLVPAAKRAGAATVVTMHDFWWLCARLFLVDRDLTPCSLVQRAGCCACEVDEAWVDERRAFLSRALASADVILAPSRAAANVLLANGLDPLRVEVEENGLPPVEVLRRSTGDSDASGGEPRVDEGQSERPLRALFLGGPHPLKGWQVLRSALQILDGQEALEVTAHGLTLSTARLTAEEATRLGLVLRPNFEPPELPSVLASADVLVLPSLMRETFSLVTREALQGGLAVVCSDSLGPEEAVRDGENGLIVPTGDVDALAEALRRLAHERGLLARLRRAAAGTPVRSADSQLDSELARHERLVARRADQERGARARTLRRVLFVAGIDGAPLRYRAQLPVEALNLEGVAATVRHYRDPALPRELLDADVVVFYRVPATVETLAAIDRLHAVGTPALCDLDDLIFDPSLEAEIPALSLLVGAERELWLQGVRRYRTTLEACDGFVASTDPLAAQAEAVTELPTYRFDNGVGLVLARLAERAMRQVGRTSSDDGTRGRGRVRIAYLSGTSTHTYDWELAEPAVAAVLEAHPEAELWLVGEIAPTAELERVAGQVRVLPTLPWTALPWLLAQVDVNLAPLVCDSRFNQAKSAIKWLEAALVETPTVASPTIPFAVAIDSGVNGLLASGDVEWAEALDRLIGDPGLRHRLGSRARRDALSGWSPHVQGRRYAEILHAAVERGVVDRAGCRWIPVAPSEPGGTVALAPYPDLRAVCEGAHDPEPGVLALFDRTGNGTGCAGERRWSPPARTWPPELGPLDPVERRRVDRGRAAARLRGSTIQVAELGTRLARLGDRALVRWEDDGLGGVVRGAGSVLRRQLRARVGASRSVPH